MLRKLYLNLFLNSAIIFTFTGCQDVQFTAPFCGPESPDRTPEVRLPEGSQGCFKVAGELNFNGFSNSIVYPMTAKDAQYIYIGYTPANEMKIGSNLGIKAFTGGICPNPLDQSGNSRLAVNFDNGWWSSQILTFSADRNSFSISQFAIDQLKLHQSGIEYVLFPSANFVSENSTKPTSSLGTMLQPELGMTLIRNDQISTLELLTRAGLESHAFGFSGTRVDDKLCEFRPVKFLTRKINSNFGSWRKL